MPAPQIGRPHLLRRFDHANRCAAHVLSATGFFQQYARELGCLLVFQACDRRHSFDDGQSGIECCALAGIVRADGLRFRSGCACRLLRKGRDRMCEFAALGGSQQIAFG